MSTIAPSSHPRALLDKSGHTAIDSVLKGLKKSSRSLQVALAAWSTDSQILDRVYYKGKNQHRGALFWRRVVELRRICGRLRRINPEQKLNIFRASFFGSDVPRNGPWSCFPDVKVTQIFMSDIVTCSKLVEKMHEQCIKAYESFTISLRGGAFLQLLLVLSALAARFSNLALELVNALTKMLELSQQVLGTITTRHSENLLEMHVNDNVDIVDPKTLEDPVESGLLQSHSGIGPNVATTSDDIPFCAPQLPSTTPSKPSRSSESMIRKKKKGRKRDEIDDIFRL
ncbi:uncharacterized protein LACBIDRAFT_305947 [Laccaria bicolor S238N-H82]|uniref:Predicted protein n=1 Tax=Laccaria bicolor (strain S238N-H82 / ATCC MYA-4686) TaxID=486041 RepID=B0CSB5_LACBS|nr:uncharacterized protein LACBIDRAFT_305947 [Laccaria bicolor S238N-H82]EDR14276.1 predicted protein [Laccaria bicolor S238N-H82]|eukprot:XP_001874835.1 predicted protein [Laccaria bicolor S238N-H82]